MNTLLHNHAESIVKKAISAVLPDAAVQRAALAEKGLDIWEVLQNNDAYHALQAVNGLIFTGPTGTNVNDIAVALYRS